MKWYVSYYNEKVQKEVFELPKTILARYLRTVDLILKFGPHLGEPHTKALGQGLFELRVKGQEGIARQFFCLMKGQEIIILHSFVKKTQKTSATDLKLARQRQKEISNDCF